MLDPGHWVIDRRIALPTIFALFFQSVALVAIGSWYASSYDSRITVNELSVVAMRNRITSVEASLNLTTTTLARIDERLVATNEVLREMKQLLQDLQADRVRANRLPRTLP